MDFHFSIQNTVGAGAVKAPARSSLEIARVVPASAAVSEVWIATIIGPAVIASVIARAIPEAIDTPDRSNRVSESVVLLLMVRCVVVRRVSHLRCLRECFRFPLIEAGWSAPSTEGL